VIAPGSALVYPLTSIKQAKDPMKYGYYVAFFRNHLVWAALWTGARLVMTRS
jgi:hypothetical protein